MNPLTKLWLRLQGLQPLSVDALAMPVPTHPAGEAREAVNDEDQARTQARVTETRNAMDRLVRQANAYIVRDYGEGPVVERDARAPTLTTREVTLLEKMEIRHDEP